ncbi:LysM peptidoglycan-binding domain-containing protein [Acetobacter lambici]|uniref:LysM peptidoglycan-binding domain-containing protein n=1 Tax=Acetobacter lambici TaxID=1332824 RepID=A0ABT1F045_9PROT|nr:LysM peptidoglycan-binding domain-containing protein [Acetobacter lambici]MCP1243068.1 LysM peptidoglycan-binding domain-containing protein [Acetobacter lambici]MCP1258576.1 LysM peptidoglycan-binding domain-containing protein [Acetobacter lambici]
MANTIKVTAADRTLYHVAASYLGDATQWWRIAQLNGLTDPDLSAFVTPVTLTLPAKDASQASGVPGVVA